MAGEAHRSEKTTSTGLSSLYHVTMRNVCIFSGSSHPALAEAISERLGTSLSAVQLDKFSNGETSVRIGIVHPSACPSTLTRRRLLDPR